jgi:hypothetical protein
VGKLTFNSYIFHHPSFPVDRLNGLSAGSTIVVENTSKQHPHRTTTNKGKKLKSGNTIVWEANLRRMTLSESSKVKFIVEGRSVVGKPPVIGFTAEYIISDLLERMEKSEKESNDIRNAYLHLKVDCRPPYQDVTLQVKVRELPTESTAKEITAHAIKQAAEKYKQESLEELQRMETDIGYFSNVLMDKDVRCMVDVMHGGLTAVRTTCESEKSHCARVVVRLLETINSIFDHHRSMIPRQTSSRNVSLIELFGSVVKSLWSIAIFMTAEFLKRAHLEFKVSAGMTYFQSLQLFIQDPQQSRPSPPEQSGRVTNLPDLSSSFFFYLKYAGTDLIYPDAKSALPSLDRVETHLPAIFEEGEDLYYHTPIRLVSRWALSSVDDSNPNIFCLSGAAGCGKSYIAGEIIKAFSELGFFGAYFSFNHHSRKGMDSMQLLESFPATIMHQIATVEPDVERLMLQEIKTLSVAEPLKSKFRKLVVNPLKDLRSSQPHWQPDYPLLIVLDDIHSCTSEVLELLLNFLCDPIMERLPSHIRFLVLSRPSEEVNRRIGKVGFEIPPSTTTTHAEESNFLISVPAERQEFISSGNSSHGGHTTS